MTGKPRVSVRIRKIKEFFAHGTKGVARHDFRGYTDEDRPYYINPEKTYLNRELLGRVKGDWERIYQQLCEIELQQRLKFEKLREQGVIPKNQGWKKTTPAFVSGIITFSEEAQEKIPAQIGMDSLDELALKFIREFEGRYGAKAVYLIRHLDETTPHYHFLFENLRDNGKMLSNTFVKPSVIQKGRVRPYQINIQEVQDLAGEVFSQVGIERGEPKEQRLARGEREYIKDLRKFKKIAKREAEKLLARLESLKLEVSELEPKVSKLRKTKQELEEELEQYERIRKAHEEELKQLLTDLSQAKRLLAQYENKLIYYKQNWEKLVNKAVKEQIDKKMNCERQKTKDLEEKFNKLKSFIKYNHGNRKIKEILSGGWDRDRDTGPNI